MRIIVMFDLPVVTDKDRKTATKFRNFLLDDGFIMMQYSVYSRICKNNDDLNKHINRLKINTPKTGNVRLLQVTENQYNNIIMFSGTKAVEEDISIDNLLIFE
ncbi:MAG: CRISPR-associated endonuclease Cas2 [Bacilli bacterium]